MKVTLVIEVEINEDNHRETFGNVPTPADVVAHVTETLALDADTEGLYDYSVALSEN